MKKRTKIVLIILAALLIIIAVIGFTQRNNIAALISFLQMDSGQLSDKIQKNKDDTQQKVEQYAPGAVRLPTKQEEEEIAEGNISPEDAAELLVNPEKPEGGEPAVTDEQSKIIGKAVAKLYAYKAYYLGQLETMASDIKAQYLALPPEEQTKSARNRILSGVLHDIAVIEDECDAKVAGIISELKAELTANGSSTEVVASIEKAYEDEKQLKKAYYLSII